MGARTNRATQTANNAASLGPRLISIEMFFFFVSGFIEETTLLLSHLSCFGGFTLGYDLTQRAGVRLFGETFHLTFNILHIHGHVFFWFGVHYVKERPQPSTFFVFTL